MGMQINTNLSALTAYRNLSTTQNDMAKSLEKLSSGLRINRAADDAAGLAISESLKSQVGGLTVAARNAQDGISVAQTAEGTLTEVHSILQRMRDLAVQAGNDSNNTDSRAAITTEATALTSELGRIATSTNFNGIKLLDGTAGTLSFQVGANGSSDNQIQVNLSSANVSNVVNQINGTVPVTTYSVASATFAGAQTLTETNPDGSVTSVTTGVLASGSTVDANVAALNADAKFNGHFIAAVATGTGTGTGTITIKALSGNAVGVANTNATAANGLTGGTASVGSGGLKFDSAVNATAAITAIDTQIKNISTARANLGAVQNRFEHTINNLNVSKENLTASRSRITDTDMASEMVNFTRASILSQAGTAMLAQANQSNQGVLQLLR